MKLPAVQLVAVEGLAQPIGGEALAVLAGPCALESLEVALQVAQELKQITARLGMPYLFKASFDKANRTALSSPRGPGLELGLEWLAAVRREVGVPVLTDVHETWQVEPVAEVVDVLQIPAFLCRQTDLLVAAARTGKVVNVKKGQFLAPDDLRYVVEKVVASGNRRLLLTERGTSFGYHDLVVDFRALRVARSFGYPVVFDATHAVQQPGGAGGASGGQREFVPGLVRAAVACGVDALFLEVHPEPARALSDAATMLPLSEVEAVLTQAALLRQALAAAPPTSWEQADE
jgi:2-dehydro-3-deoxyphosphooctonate aldolase (KDO 8-P synthase)